MPKLDHIPALDAKALDTLEANARRVLERGPASRQAEAEKVLEAILAERIRRTEQERERRRAARSEVLEKVKDLTLFDRVILAFEEVLPAEWEVRVLRAISEQPGADFNTLARHVGAKDGGYINLAVGKLCGAREAFLGAAPPVRNKMGDKHYSSLLIDWERNVGPDGAEWHGWRLKPEAEAALRHLGILGASAGR